MRDSSAFSVFCCLFAKKKNIGKKLCMRAPHFSSSNFLREMARKCVERGRSGGRVFVFSQERGSI